MRNNGLMPNARYVLPVTPMMDGAGRGECNIVAVEGPVEYRLDGIVRTQVHSAIDYGFSTALRRILRHDPDVVLIGKIRDRETANSADESALTGHLVLSTNAPRRRSRACSQRERGVFPLTQPASAQARTGEDSMADVYATRLH